MQISRLFSIVAVVGVAAAFPKATPTKHTATSASATASVSATSSPTCSPGPVTDYVVRSGDTLTIISQRFGSGICNIAYASGITNPNFLSIGQSLKVPTHVCNPDNTSCLAREGSDTCVEGGPATRTIVAGDTFFIVAQSLGLDVNALLAANEGVDPLLLQVGDVINIPVC
ncbi:Intracellular hyphae protein 1 [Colletotrichum shisoi]|uniref:Intracellular hyphae protein 1 n=1 Tax=Colletotrichum shisoi TaxID=2078593 RepID=A0A5Q4BGY6_9PEZI|nr:Intracellular hyphae protein 1 [Colletotrichum shisoi]